MPEPAKSTVADVADDTQPPVKPFGAFLHEHRDAGLHNEAGEELATLVAAVLDQQKKGSLTITFTVEPAKGDDRQVVISDDVKVKAPKPPTPASRFFSDPHGNLSRRDPRQPELSGLRDASAS